VVTSYLLTFGSLLPLAARLGDLLDREAVWQAGLVLFTAGSLAGGLDAARQRPGGGWAVSGHRPLAAAPRGGPAAGGRRA
jgi:MFS family permease